MLLRGRVGFWVLPPVVLVCWGEAPAGGALHPSADSSNKQRHCSPVTAWISKNKDLEVAGPVCLGKRSVSMRCRALCQRLERVGAPGHGWCCRAELWLWAPWDLQGCSAHSSCQRCAMLVCEMQSCDVPARCSPNRGAIHSWASSLGMGEQALWGCVLHRQLRAERGSLWHQDLGRESLAGCRSTMSCSQMRFPEWCSGRTVLLPSAQSLNPGTEPELS